MNLYVYYRVKPAMHTAWRQIVAELQQELAPGCTQVQLAHRADDPDTWMEVYENVGDRHAFSQNMARFFQSVDLERYLVSMPDKMARMEEWFERMPR